MYSLPPKRCYALRRGHLLYVYHIASEQLISREKTRVIKTRSPYDYQPRAIHPDAEVRIILNAERYYATEHSYDAPKAGYDYTLESFCECGNHDTHYIHATCHFQSFERSEFMRKSTPTDFSCSSCGAKHMESPTMEFHNFHARSYSDISFYRKRGTPIKPHSMEHTKLDACILFDDFLEQGKISLKFIGHATFYDPNKVRITSNDVHRRLIYSSKTGRVYYKAGRRLEDVTYYLGGKAIDLTQEFFLEHNYRQQGLFEGELPSHGERLLHDTLAYFFGDFCRRVFDVMDAPLWASPIDAVAPLQSLELAFMSKISPAAHAAFSWREPKLARGKFAKNLRLFDNESDAMDALINQPSGFFRKALRNSLDVTEFRYLMEVGLKLASLFKDPNHLNTLVATVQASYREYVKEGRFYRYASHNAKNIIKGRSMFVSIKDIEKAVSLSLDELIQDNNTTVKLLNPTDLRLKHDTHDPYLERIPLTVQLNRKKHKFEPTLDARTAFQFKSNFKLSDARLVLILEEMIRTRMSKSETSLLDLHVLRDMSRLLSHIHRNFPEFMPKLGLDMHVEEQRLSRVYNRIGLKNYAFSYKPELFELETEIDGHRFRLPKMSSELSNLGNRLSHCVGGYHEHVENGFTAIFIVEQDDHYVLAIEVRGTEVVQIKGMNNNLGYYIPKELAKIVKKWAHHNKLTMKTHDLDSYGQDPVPYVPSDYTQLEEIVEYDLEALYAIHRGRVGAVTVAPSLTYEELRTCIEEDRKLLIDHLDNGIQQLDYVAEPRPYIHAPVDAYMVPQYQDPFGELDF
ncbi:hypothetical protein C0431_13055 [bacterium]|nr:hypothetical protein [bacterium]